MKPRRHLLATAAVGVAVAQVFAATPVAASPNPRPVPQVVFAHATTASSVALAWRWTYGVPRPQRFEIEAGTVADGAGEPTPATWTAQGSTPGTAHAFTAGGLAASTTYVFRIRARTVEGDTGWAVSSPVTTAAINSLTRATVVAPTMPGNPRNGEGSLVELRDGRLMYTYGRYEGLGDLSASTIAARTSDDGGATWSAESILFGQIGGAQSFIQPSVVRMADGGLGVSYTVAEATDSAWKVFSRSYDEGVTWSGPTTITDGSFGYMTGSNARLYVLSTGRLLQAINIKLSDPDSRAVIIFTSDDNGRTWTNQTPGGLRADIRLGLIEPAIAEYGPGQLLMLMRTTQGFLWQSRSRDFGASWTTPERSDVTHPAAPPLLTRMPNGPGIVLITTADAPEGSRRVLASRISLDGGVTWTNYRQIEYRSNARVHYPAMLYARDRIHLVYYAAPGSFGGTGHLSLPSDWFRAREAFPYGPSTTIHIAGETATFTAVSGGANPVAGTEVLVDGRPVTLVDGRLILAPGYHTVAYRSTDTAGSAERWRETAAVVW
ncbi:exo-alpha-sialidase [Plantactinospora sp. CA-294935]|uniref:exo-alpha-sialidase n=1 Tax=Plantactinospora sp. CA-294935 TaxID=3240012 RepID=UPI003D8D9D09